MSENKSLALTQSHSLFPSAEELGLIKDQAMIYVKSGLLPKTVDTPEKAILIMMKGRELGIPPLQALAGIFVIEGKTVIGAELMTAQVYRNCPGAMLDIIETTNEDCIVTAARPGKKPVEFKFTMEDAKAAGVTNKDNWRKYPATMLRWRALSMACKSMFPDAVAGCLTPDEAEDVALGHGGSGAAHEEKAARLAALARKPEPKDVDAVVVDPVVTQEPKPEPVRTVAPPKPTLVAAMATIKAAAEPEPSWDEDMSGTVGPAYDPLAEYVLKGGHTLKTKKIGSIDTETLAAFVANTKEYFKRNNKALTGVNLEDVSRIEDYLRTREPELAQAAMALDPRL